MSVTSQREPALAALPGAAPPSRGTSLGPILLGVFGALDRAGIRYCVLHGFEDFPHAVKSDVDCVIDARVTPRRLIAALHAERERIGAEVVRASGYHLVLAGPGEGGPPSVLTLDFGADCALDALVFCPGAEVLDSRRRHGAFWVPAPATAFGCYLARTIAKARLDENRAERLSGLFAQDREGCAEQVGRFWGAQSADFIERAARSGDWGAVRRRQGDLGAELRRGLMLRRPGRFLGAALRGATGRLERFARPGGLDVVLLGPDGAGKSSLVAALEARLGGAFARSTCVGFAPALLGRLRARRPRSTQDPHGLPPRSLPASLLRAGYWFAFQTIGYAQRRVALARSSLVLNDRHFVDILVDPRRYRYGGPFWLLRLIWRLSPRPDLVVLLDAPPQVLQARKQEVSFEETARQCDAYRALVRRMANGHVVDAAKPREHVVAEVSDVILRRLAARVARRFGLAPKTS